MSASSSSPAAAARFSSLPLSDYRSNEVDLAKCTFLLDPTLPFEEADAALAAIRAKRLRRCLVVGDATHLITCRPFTPRPASSWELQAEAHAEGVTVISVEWVLDGSSRNLDDHIIYDPDDDIDGDNDDNHSNGEDDDDRSTDSLENPPSLADLLALEHNVGPPRPNSDEDTELIIITDDVKPGIGRRNASAQPSASSKDNNSVGNDDTVMRPTKRCRTSLAPSRKWKKLGGRSSCRPGGGGCPRCGAMTSSAWRNIKGVSGGYHCSGCRYFYDKAAAQVQPSGSETFDENEKPKGTTSGPSSRWWYYETVFGSGTTIPTSQEGPGSPAIRRPSISSRRPTRFPRPGGGACPTCGVEFTQEWRVIEGDSGGYHCANCSHRHLEDVAPAVQTPPAQPREINPRSKTPVASSSQLPQTTPIFDRETRATTINQESTPKTPDASRESKPGQASRFWYYETVWASSHWEPDLPESHLSSNRHPKLFPRTGGGSCPMCGAEASSEWRVLKGVSGGYHCSRCRYLYRKARITREGDRASAPSVSTPTQPTEKLQLRSSQMTSVPVKATRGMGVNKEPNTKIASRKSTSGRPSRFWYYETVSSTSASTSANQQNPDLSTPESSTNHPSPGGGGDVSCEKGLLRPGGGACFGCGAKVSMEWRVLPGVSGGYHCSKCRWHHRREAASKQHTPPQPEIPTQTREESSDLTRRTSLTRIMARRSSKPYDQS